MKRILWLGLCGIIGMGVSGFNQAAPQAATALKVAAADNAAAVSATGVVVQVRADQGKVKINHDPISALNWPQMTMFFRVTDKTVLEGIAAGDKVRFELGKDAAGWVITRMEKAAK